MGLTSEPSRSSSTSYVWHALAGVLFSIFIVASFPPIGVWPLAFVAVVPLVWSAYHPARRAMLGAACVSLGTLPMWFYQERWLINVTQEGYPLLAIYLSAYAGVFVWLLAFASRRFSRAGIPIPAVVLTPILWTALEFIRGDLALTGYAWLLVGHPLIESTWLAAPAALLGAYLVSFLVAALSGALADAAGWTTSSRSVGGAGAGLIAVVWVVAALIGRAPDPGANAPSLRVGIVQSNLPQDNKLAWSAPQREHDFENFLKLTREAVAKRPRPDVIFWPETMYPGSALNPEYLVDLDRLARERNIDPNSLSDITMARRLGELQRDSAVPFVIGAQSLAGFDVVASSASRSSEAATRFDHRFNSAIIVENGEPRAERYDKVELTPFGEVIPYLWRWKSVQAWIERVGAGGMKFDLSFGEKIIGLPLTISKEKPSSASTTEAPERLTINLLTPICFEATKSSHCRALALAAVRSHSDQPRLLVNLSNDGWFGNADGLREQHFLAARWRCVELGAPMVRAVNTGLSGVIDARGQVPVHTMTHGTNAVRTFSEGVVIESVTLAPASAVTIFTRTGNVFAWGTLVLAGVLLVASLVVGRRGRAAR